MTVCKICGKDVPHKELFAHRNAEHADEVAAQLVRSAETRKKKAALRQQAKDEGIEVPPARKPNKKPAKDGSKLAPTSNKVVSVTAPAPGALDFRFGHQIITIDPDDFADCYTLYRVMRAHGLTGDDSFSKTMLGVFSLVWDMVDPTKQALRRRNNGDGTEERYGSGQIGRVTGNPEGSFIENESDYDQLASHAN